MDISLIWDRMNQIRLEKGISVYKLTQLAGLSANTIYAWENKRSRPTISSLLLVAEALNVDVASLMAPDETGCRDPESECFAKKFSSLTEEHRKLMLALMDKLLLLDELADSH